MRTALLAAVLALLYLATRGFFFNWDALYLARLLEQDDVANLFNPYRPLALLPYHLAWRIAPEGTGPLDAVTALNAILAGLAMALFWRLLARETASPGAALACTLATAFSTGFWIQAPGGKWYAFSTLLAVLSLLALHWWEERPEDRPRAAVTGAGLGLALLAHATLISLAVAVLSSFGRRPAARGTCAAVAFATVALGLGAMLAPALAKAPPGDLAALWRRDYEIRRQQEHPRWRLVQRLPLQVTGWPDPGSEVLGLPAWSTPAGAGALALLAGVLAATWRGDGRPVHRALWLFLPLHPAFLALTDSSNQNLLATLLPFWGLLAWPLARAPRPAVPTAMVLALGLGAFNYLACVAPTLRPEGNPWLAESRWFDRVLGADGLLLTRESLQGNYHRYVLGERALTLMPHNAGWVRQRLEKAAAEGRPVLLDPLILDRSDGWAPEPDQVTEALAPFVWAPAVRRPGQAPVLELLP